MSTGANNLFLITGNRRSGHNNGDRDRSYDDGNEHSLPRPLSLRSGSEGTEDPWWSFEERVRTGPFGLIRFPSQPHSPIRIFFVQDGTVNPRMRQFVQESPRRIRQQWHLEQQGPGEEDAFNEEEFMGKIKKQVYHSNSKTARRRGLFDNRNYPAEERASEEKQCPVCLEAFVPNDKVLLTSCNHMFHNKCLVPWVRSHGQCPVCRFQLSQVRTRPDSYGAGDQLMGTDLVSLISAMEEAFEWLTIPHH